MSDLVPRYQVLMCLASGPYRMELEVIFIVVASIEDLFSEIILPEFSLKGRNV